MSFAEYTDAIKAFVTLHREWAAPIVFVLAFGESLAFVSLILPFWGMLVVIGTIIGASDSLSFWGIMTAAAVGAALGDWLSYWLGFHYHEQIQRMWPQPLSQPPRRPFLHVLGAWAVVIGRFSGLCARACDRRRHHPDARFGSRLPIEPAFLWAFVLSPGSFGLKWWLDYFLNGASEQPRLPSRGGAPLSAAIAPVAQPPRSICRPQLPPQLGHCSVLFPSCAIPLSLARRSTRNRSSCATDARKAGHGSGAGREGAAAGERAVPQTAEKRVFHRTP
jgi:membrane protein YqaA with SNARE-associated domain